MNFNPSAFANMSDKQLQQTISAISSAAAAGKSTPQSGTSGHSTPQPTKPPQAQCEYYSYSPRAISSCLPKSAISNHPESIMAPSVQNRCLAKTKNKDNYQNSDLHPSLHHFDLPVRLSSPSSAERYLQSPPAVCSVHQSSPSHSTTGTADHLLLQVAHWCHPTHATNIGHNHVCVATELLASSRHD